MKSFSYYFSILLMLLTLTVTGCELVGDIMEFTMWTTLIGVALVVIIIMWIVRKVRGPRDRF